MKRLLFIVIYVPFAVAAIVYIITGGSFGAEAMVEAAFLPWWLPLVATPLLLLLVLVGLAKFGLDDYL